MALIPKTIELSTRVFLPYVEQGDPAGVPIIFLHGFLDTGHSFSPVLPYLPGSIHAFGITRRGHGDASRPPAGYSIVDFAADLVTFIENLPWLSIGTNHEIQRRQITKNNPDTPMKMKIRSRS